MSLFTADKSNRLQPVRLFLEPDVFWVSPMDAILVKIFATALALSEVTTQPQPVKTHFDPVQDRAQVVQILRTVARICVRRSISSRSTLTI